MGHLFGLETEYGLAMPSAERGDDVIGTAAWTLIDTAASLVPALRYAEGSGWFLANGSRIYVDSSHPELATPEVSTPWEAVRHTLAGDRLLARALTSPRAAPFLKSAVLFKSNVDYHTRGSWGAHESVFINAKTSTQLTQLVPHLVSRLVYAGAGGFDPFSPGVEFVLSPRALFIHETVSDASTHSRGILHTKNEPLGHGPHQRLHLICGESLCSERAMWLKTATTVLVTAMLDGGVSASEGLERDDAVAALHTFTRDPTGRADVPLANGRRTTALALQRHFLGLAEHHAGAPFMPAWTWTACLHWRDMLDALESGASSIETTLDWAIKRALFTRVLARHGFTWDLAERWTAALRELWAKLTPSGDPADPPEPECLLELPLSFQARRLAAPSITETYGLKWPDLACFARVRRELFETDLRFGQLGGKGIFAALDREGVLTHHMPGLGDIDHAIEHPPVSGRAHVRGEAIRRLADDPKAYRCDWTIVHSPNADLFLDLSNPFVSEERWRPVTELRGGIRRMYQLPEGPPMNWNAGGRREAAWHDFLAGNYAAAEATLTQLLAEGFEVPSTRRRPGRRGGLRRASSSDGSSGCRRSSPLSTAPTCAPGSAV